MRKHLLLLAGILLLAANLLLTYAVLGVAPLDFLRAPNPMRAFLRTYPTAPIFFALYLLYFFRLFNTIGRKNIAVTKKPE